MVYTRTALIGTKGPKSTIMCQDPSSGMNIWVSMSELIMDNRSPLLHCVLLGRNTNQVVTIDPKQVNFRTVNDRFYELSYSSIDSHEVVTQVVHSNMRLLHQAGNIGQLLSHAVDSASIFASVYNYVTREVKQTEAVIKSAQVPVAIEIEVEDSTVRKFKGQPLFAVMAGGLLVRLFN